jgi:hypothetical protein
MKKPLEIRGIRPSCKVTFPNPTLALDSFEICISTGRFFVKMPGPGKEKPLWGAKELCLQVLSRYSSANRNFVY